MDRTDIYWIVGIIVAVVAFNLLQPTTVTTTEAGQPIAGQGTDPYDAGEFALATVATLGGV